MKMAAAMPQAVEANGLVGVHKRLIQDPTAPILAIVVLNSSQTLVDHEKGSKTPTIKVLHVEPMVDRDQQYEAQRLLERAYMERTTQQMELPYEFEPIRTPSGQDVLRPSARAVWEYEKREDSDDEQP